MGSLERDLDPMGPASVARDKLCARLPLLSSHNPATATIPSPVRSPFPRMIQISSPTPGHPQVSPRSLSLSLPPPHTITASSGSAASVAASSGGASAAAAKETIEPVLAAAKPKVAAHSAPKAKPVVAKAHPKVVPKAHNPRPAHALKMAKASAKLSLRQRQQQVIMARLRGEPGAPSASVGTK